MHTYLMFGKRSAHAPHNLNNWRTEVGRRIIGDLGGTLTDGYALLGEYDLCLIAQFPRMADAMRAAVALSKATDMSFRTCAATSLDELDEVIAEIEMEIEAARMEAHE